jgi:hypothetical protein
LNLILAELASKMLSGEIPPLITGEEADVWRAQIRRDRELEDLN